MASGFTLRQLEYFVEAATAGTMAAAAKRLAASPSAVSTGIGELESHFGAALLTRVPHRPLAPTQAGTLLLELASELLAATGELGEMIRASAHGDGGTCRFGCFPPFAPKYLPGLLDAAARRDVPITLDVVEREVEELHQDLIDGTVDIGLMYGLDIPSALATEVVALHAPYVLLPPGHPCADRSEVSITELVNEPMVMLDARPSPYFDDLLDSLGASVTITHRSDGVETVRALVGRGAGWSLMMGVPRGGVTQEGFTITGLPLADHIEPMPVVAAWQAGVELTGRAAAVVEICHAVVGATSDRRYELPRVGDRAPSSRTGDARAE